MGDEGKAVRRGERRRLCCLSRHRATGRESSKRDALFRASRRASRHRRRGATLLRRHSGRRIDCLDARGAGDGRERREHLGKAGFASRGEAVAHARATIALRKATLRRQFMDVTQRALRERHGFPRELPEALAATYDDAMRALKSGRSKS
jgi:hypothetical protein